MQKLIAIIRKPDGLKALVNNKKYDIGYWALENYKDKLNDFYESKEISLESLRGEKWFDKNGLLKSWNYLSKVDRWDEETLFHIFYVLIETDPIFDEEEDFHLPPLKFEQEPKPAKATAANPRGIKGTKNKFLKTKKVQPINLQRYLCSRKHVTTILKKLQPHWPEGYARLAAMGYETDALPSDLSQFPSHLHPYFVVHHNLTKDTKNYKLPAPFVKHILPSLKGLEWKKVTEFLSIYWELSLDKNVQLLTSISQLLSFNITASSFNLCRLIASQPKNHQIELAIRTLLWEAHLVPPENFDLKKAINLLNTSNQENRANRFALLIAFMKQNFSLDYLLEGFKLAEKFNQKNIHNFYSNCPDFPFKKFQTFLTHIQKSPNFDDWTPIEYWKNCGQRDWFKQLILEEDWGNFSPTIADEFIYILYKNLDGNKSADRSATKQIFIKKQIFEIKKHLSILDENYKVAYLKNLGEFLFFWDKTNVAKATAYLDTAHQILIKTCQKPFKKTIDTAYLISFFIDETSLENRTKFLQAPVSSFLNMQKAANSRNAASLITPGIVALLRSSDEFTVQCFIHYSQKLFKVAKCLGALPRFERKSLMKEFRSHPLMKSRVKDLKAKQICPLVKNFLQPGITNPIPKRLNECLNGKTKLTETQINNFVDKLKVALNSTRLDILEKMVLDRLSQNLPISKEDENHMHTLQFLNVIEENRRPIKRFIKALHEGQTDYLETHPITQNWINRHKKVPLKKWTSGFHYTGDTEKYGKVTITLEQNPMEVLKMGTYVGSCLGLGGDYSYNAAATVLDINKQVLYARNSDNKVVGRQLIAISKKNDLVCFEVYPVNVNTEVKDLFCEYDLMLADFLGLNLFEDSDKPMKPKKKKDGEYENYYEIENILSSEWYDDYVWDFK